MKNDAFILREERFCCSPKNLWIREIHKTNDSCTEKVNKKDRFIRIIVVNEFL